MTTEKTPTLEDIRTIVEDAAQKQMGKIVDIDDFLRARSNLEQFSKDKRSEFTFTVGEVNAYMG